MKILLLIVLIGIAVAGLAAVVAIWVERDVKRPRKFAWALSVLILLATGVTILQAVLQDKQDKIEKAADEAEKQKLQGDVARMMQSLDKIASESGDPRLQQFLSTEIEAQSRANPEIVQKLAQRYADEGEDPAEKLAKHLPNSEVQKMARSGSIKTVPSAVKIERKREAPVVVPTARPIARPATDTGTAGEEGAGGAAGETGAIEPTAAGAARGSGGAIRGLGVAGASGGPAIGVKKPPSGGAKPGKKKPATTDKR
jgi:HAMP domain-containing protein